MGMEESAKRMAAHAVVLRRYLDDEDRSGVADQAVMLAVLADLCEAMEALLLNAGGLERVR